jgi:hypothetical protein
MSIVTSLSDPCNRLNHIIETENCFISQHFDRIENLKNGIECYFVEVTSRSGIRHGIWAHGSQANELYQHTLRILSIEKFN